MSQIDLFQEIIVDNFAGGGGASTGIELACGRPVTYAINHDPDAILMHQTNHPYTTHFQDSVWNIDPVAVCKGSPVGLAWFSPDCKHFSKAKGGKPKDKRIRGLAWVACKWAALARPRVIMLENVEEFQEWGPLGRKGKPIKAKKGKTFQKFVGQIQELGYAVEWRELVAADYGAPTTRKRFFLIARCDGRPIVWPEATHAPADSPEVNTGKKLPWRSAAEIIDWSLPCPSIFATKEDIKEQYGLKAVRPLKLNTMRRVARGLDKFVLKSGKPFIVLIGYGERQGQSPRVHDISGPLPTCVGGNKHYICCSDLAPWTVTNTSNSVGHPVSEPMDTIRTGDGGGQMLVSANLIQYHTEQTEFVRGQALSDPICTVDAANRYGLSAATLVKYFGNDQHGQTIRDPLHTVTSKDREGLCMASLSKFYGGVVGTELTEPVPTVTAVDHNSLQVAHIAEFKGQDIGQDAGNPLRTITAGGGQFGAVQTTVVRYHPKVKLGYWPEVRNLLNEYCGYTLAENEILLLDISGIWYYIADIGLRMLTPRELYAANGFPADYIIDRDHTGKAYGRTKQVARCGNAVPPPFATALVRANLPEWCGGKITTMEQFERLVAV